MLTSGRNAYAETNNTADCWISRGEVPMDRRYTAKPHLDRLLMGRLGSALRPEYDPLVKIPLPPRHQDLVLEYTAAEAASEPKEKRVRPPEVIPYLPN